MRKDKVMKKEESGSFDYSFVENKDLLVKCNNSVVTVGTTHQTVESFASAKWWTTAKHQNKTTPQSRLIAKNNLFMGGVDHYTGLYKNTALPADQKVLFFLLTNCLDVQYQMRGLFIRSMQKRYYHCCNSVHSSPKHTSNFNRHGNLNVPDILKSYQQM